PLPSGTPAASPAAPSAPSAAPAPGAWGRSACHPAAPGPAFAAAPCPCAEERGAASVTPCCPGTSPTAPDRPQCGSATSAPPRPLSSRQALQLDQQFNVMLRLEQIFQAILILPAGHVLDHVALAEPETIGMDVLHWLDGFVLVVIAAWLHCQRRALCVTAHAYPQKSICSALPAPPALSRSAAPA